MKRMKTKVEYRATAMLLGMAYNTVTNCYYRPEHLGIAGTWIDADTMEPVDYRERENRRSKWLRDARDWVTTGGNDDIIPTPDITTTPTTDEDENL
jgi:hypothetical protein